MPLPSESEVAAAGRADAPEAIEIARRRDRAFPVATIADGADRNAQTTGFNRSWWRQLDEEWPERLRETYNEAFTRELMTAEVAVVELHFDAAAGDWTNVGVVDLKQWEPTFDYDPASSGWVRQDARSRVGWRRRSALKKLFSRKSPPPGSNRQPPDYKSGALPG